MRRFSRFFGWLVLLAFITAGVFVVFEHGVEDAQAAIVTVSGTIYQSDGTTPYDCSADNLTVAVRVNGGGASTVTCTAAGGTYSVAGSVSITAADDTVTVYLDDETPNAVTYTLSVDAVSAITLLDLYQNHVIIRSESATAVTNTELEDWDYADEASDGDIGVDIVTGNATLRDGWKLLIWTGDTFAPGGTVTTSVSNDGTDTNVDGDVHIDGTLDVDTNALSVGGDLTNTGAFGTFVTAGSNVTTFTATALGHTISDSGSNNFREVTFNGVGGGWSFAQSRNMVGHLNMTNGTLIESGSEELTVFGSVQGTNGIINLAGTSTLRQRASTSGRVFGPTTATTDWTFYNLVFSSELGGQTITTQSCSDCDVTVTNQLKVSRTGDAGTSITLDAGDKTWTLSSADQADPFNLDEVSGVLTANASTFNFAGDNNSGDVTLENTTFYNLTLTSDGVAENYSPEGSVIVANDLAINEDATLIGTQNVTVNGNATCGATCGAITLTGGTFTHAVPDAGNSFGTNVAEADVWTFNNLTFDNTAAGASDITINGTGTGIIAVSGNLLTSTTGGGVLTLDNATNDRVLDIAGNVTINASTILQVAGAGVSFTVGGSWTNSGTFTAGDGTVTFDSHDAGETLSGNMTGANAFYHVQFNDGTNAEPASFAQVGEISSEGPNNVPTNLVLEVPAGVQSGDLLVAVLTVNVTADDWEAGTTGVTDFTKLAGVGDLFINFPAYDRTLQVWYRHADGSELAEYTWDPAGAGVRERGGWLIAFRPPSGFSFNAGGAGVSATNNVTADPQGTGTTGVPTANDVLYLLGFGGIGADADMMVPVWTGGATIPTGHPDRGTGGTNDHISAGWYAVTNGAAGSESFDYDVSLWGGSAALITGWEATMIATTLSDASWEIQDPMLVDGAETDNTFVIGNGTVTVGNSDNDDLEIRGTVRIATTANEIGTLQSRLAIPQGEEIVIDIGSNTPELCEDTGVDSCIIYVGASSGTGTGILDISANTRLRLNAFNDGGGDDSDVGIEVESTGYLEIHGTQDDAGTLTQSGTIEKRSTHLCSTESYTDDEHNGKHVRITNTSSLAFGRIYEIIDTIDGDSTNCINATHDSVVFADESTADDTDSITIIDNVNGTWDVTINDGIVTSDNRDVGRYLRNLTDDEYYLIVGTDVATDVVTIVANPDDPTSSLSATDSVDISDGIRHSPADTFEVYDFATVQAESDSCAASDSDSAAAFIYAKAGSETLVRHADICDFGRSSAGRYGITVEGVDASLASTSFLLDKSRIIDTHYGVYVDNSDNLSAANNSGITNNYIEDITLDAVTVDGTSDYLEILRNRTHRPRSNSAFISGFGTLVEDNVFVGRMDIAHQAVYFDQSSGMSVKNNKIFGTTIEAVRNNGSDRSLISGNTIAAAEGDVGIEVNNGRSHIIAGNTIYAVGTHGMDIRGASGSQALIFGNTILGVGSNGIRIAGVNDQDIILAGNVVDGSGGAGLVIAGSAVSVDDTVILGDSYGVTYDNTTADIEFQTAFAHDITAYNTILSSSTGEATGITTSGAYLISRAHDGVSTTKIWNDYTIRNNDTETPQDEGLIQFNYADALWEDSITEPIFRGSGSEDSNINIGFSAAMAGADSAYGYRLLADAGVADCDVDDAQFSVFRYDLSGAEVDVGTATCGTQFTDGTTNVFFTIGGTSGVSVGDTYTFAAWKASMSNNATKTLEFMQDGDKLTVGSGESVSFDGASVTRGTGNIGGYQIDVLSGGSIDMQNTTFSYLGAPYQDSGITIASGATLTDLQSTTFINFKDRDLRTTDLVLHFEADSGISTGGGVVTGWNDQSGNGNHLTSSGDPTLLIAATPSGEAAVYFDSVGDKLERIDTTDTITGLPSGSADRTVFLIARYIDDNGVWAGAVYGDGAANETFGLTSRSLTGLLAVQGWGGGNDFVSATAGVGAGWLLQSARVDTDTLLQWKDGVQIDGPDVHTYATDVQTIVLGEEISGLGFAELEIAAYLVYDVALSDAERAHVETYLMDKYLTVDASMLEIDSSLIGAGTPSRTFTGNRFIDSNGFADCNINATGADAAGYFEFRTVANIIGSLYGEDFDCNDGVADPDPGQLNWIVLPTPAPSGSSAPKTLTIDADFVPTDGDAPLRVDVIPMLGGTAGGPIDFVLDCGNGSSVSILGTFFTSQQMSCLYDVDGTYTSTLIVTRDDQSAQITQVVTVGKGFEQLPLSFRDGELLRAEGEDDVWVLRRVGDKLYRRLILNEAVFEGYMHFLWNGIVEVAQSVIDSITESLLVKTPDNPTVYELAPNGDAGTRTPIPDISTFNARGYDWDSVYIINENERDAYAPL